MKGKVVSINISNKKGVSKKPVKKAFIKENYGIEGDIHAGNHERQISLLAVESIKKFNIKHCPKLKGKEIEPGAFAENITTSGINFKKIKIGDKIIINNILLEVSKIGKDCHRYCSIYYKVGDCIMPREGIFCKVLKGGVIKVGDKIEVQNKI